MARHVLLPAALAALVAIPMTVALPAAATEIAPPDADASTVVGEVRRLAVDLRDGGHVDLTVVVPEEGEAVRVQDGALDDVPSGAVVEVALDAAPAPTDVTDPDAGVGLAEVTVLEQPEAGVDAPPGLAAAIQPGTRTADVLSARIGNQAAGAVTASTIATDVLNQAAPYWLESTDGRITFAVGNRIDVATPHTWTGGSACTENGIIGFLEWIAVQAGMTGSHDTREHAIVHTPRFTACGFEGVAYQYDGGVAWVNGPATVADRRKTVVHELGHTLSLGHSDTRVWCGPYGADADGTVAACVEGPYGDVYDIMGSSIGGYGLLSGAHLERLGMLDSTNSYRVSAPTTVTLRAVGSGTEKRFLRFIDGSAIYHVEFRGAVGRDADLAAGTRRGCPDGIVCESGIWSYSPGVVVHRVDASLSGHSSLLDAGRGDPRWSENDAWFVLPAGRTFTTASGRWTVVTEATATATARVRLERGPATPQKPYAQMVTTADVTGDRLGDVITLDKGGRMQVHPGRGNGRLTAARSGTAGWSGLALYAPGDWSGDGRNDLVSTDAKGALWLHVGDGRGSFPLREQIGHGWVGFRIIPVGDLNGDRTTDMLAIDSRGRLWFYPGVSPGVFGKRIQVGNGWTGFQLHPAGDGNGDGRADILGIDAGGKLWFYAGTGGGFFAKRSQVGQGWGGFTFASGVNLDAEPRPDLMGRDRSGRLWFYSGRANGAFTKAVQVDSGW